MTLSQSRFHRLLALCLLYFSQGVPYGYVYVTLAAILADGGHTVSQIGSVLAVGSFPWTFKPVAAMAVDRFRQSPMGVRRPWILAAQIGLALTTIILIFANIGRGADFKVLMWGVLAQNIFAALQDVAADALAIDHLKPEERARANGLMLAAMQIGIMAGGVGATHILGVLGIRGVLLLQVALFVGIGSYFFAVRERPMLTAMMFAYSRAEPAWQSMTATALVLGRAALTSTLAVSMYAILMAQSSRKVAATQFTVYMALLNLGGTAGAKAVGWVQEAGNWTGVFFTIGLLYGAALIVLTLMPVQYQPRPRPIEMLSA